MSTAETLATSPEEITSAPEAAPELTQSALAEHPGVHAHQGAPPPLNPELTRDVEVVIPADEVSGAFRRILKNYTRQARIPGFRAGKVPPTLIRKRFDEQIRQDVVEQLLPNHFRAALDAQGVQPISQPQVTELELEDGQPLRFKALFEVMPELSLEGWEEIRVPREAAELTEDEFNAEMERVRDSRSTMEPVEEERELADGDYAVITFSGAVQGGEPLDEPIAGQDIQLEVGSANTLPAFNDALRGAKPGQELKFEVSYPEDFGEPRLRGRTIAYEVQIKGIKRKNAPELNDDFAKELGSYDTLEEFQTKLREHLSGDKRRQGEAATKDKILEALAERYKFPVPESLVQQAIDARLDRGLRALAQQGMGEEQMRQLDFPRLRAAQREGAFGEVQGTLLLDKLAQLENVEVAEAELDRELELLAVQSREPLPTLRERLEKDNSMERIREQIRREKTGALLYEKLGQ